MDLQKIVKDLDRVDIALHKAQIDKQEMMAEITKYLFENNGHEYMKLDTSKLRRHAYRK